MRLEVLLARPLAEARKRTTSESVTLFTSHNQLYMRLLNGFPKKKERDLNIASIFKLQFASVRGHHNKHGTAWHEHFLQIWEIPRYPFDDFGFHFQRP